jgi:hypothetical protein
MAMRRTATTATLTSFIPLDLIVEVHKMWCVGAWSVGAWSVERGAWSV